MVFHNCNADFITGKAEEVLPRMAALAEVQWMQPERKDYQSFRNRLPRLIDLYRLYGWKYCDL